MFRQACTVALASYVWRRLRRVVQSCPSSPSLISPTPVDESCPTSQLITARKAGDLLTVTNIAEEAARQAELIDADLTVLHRCIEKLSPLDRNLVETRYASSGSVKRLTKLLGKSAGAVSQNLYRIRGELADCVDRERRTGL